MKLKRITLIMSLCLSVAPQLIAGVIKGQVTECGTGEPLIGATVFCDNTHGTVTDIEGNYELNLPKGLYNIKVSYVGYNDTISDGIKVLDTSEAIINFQLRPSGNELNEVVVSAKAQRKTEKSMIAAQRSSLVVQSGVSAQQIELAQDKDASEVIRRVPGISIIDDKFVMVRGLSQRYNNVWINGGAVPSSEADSRAFSFDVIPGGQIDNMQIIKSPAPEYPADFTGGFVLVNTKEPGSSQKFNISLGYGYNSESTFRRFLKAKGSCTDWLGFDGGMRVLKGGINTVPVTYPGRDVEIDPVASGFNNDWRLRTIHPVGDVKLAASYANGWQTEGGSRIGLISALNYSNSYRTYLDMENSLYGPYDFANDRPIYLRKSTDNQYTNDVRLGAMLNLSFRPGGHDSYFDWKNIFNQLGKDRFSERRGINAQPDSINNMEYYYSSRTTYNTQFTGRHSLFDGDIDWSAGYSYANRNLPDRRLIERTDRTDNIMGIYRIRREYTHLDENIFSANANYKKNILENVFPILIKGGVYGEYRNRTYRTRQFQYGWQPDNKLPQGWIFNDDIPTNILIDSNYGPDKLFIYEDVNYLNNYDGRQANLAGYLSANFNWNKVSIYAGVRYEYCRQTLGMNTRQYEPSMHDTHYKYSDFFPSVNVTYHLNEMNQVRAAYGRSVNRPEFRELSPSVFYDFDLGSSVMGNYDLKAAYIENIDLRYEWYPSAGEQISVAMFYKHFSNPIEWTYTVAGGTDLIYSYMNARAADNYGIELDIRKSFDFIGVPDLSMSLNGSLIKSRVKFEEGTNNIDRPMQGQSPYLVNVGLFYSNQDKGWNASLLYNVIGKRIIGVGNRYGSTSEGESRNIPSSYEMPRNVIDLSLSKKIQHWEIKLSLRDILAQDYVFKQIENTVEDGKSRHIENTTKRYKPGRNIGLTISYNF